MFGEDVDDGQDIVDSLVVLFMGPHVHLISLPLIIYDGHSCLVLWIVVMHRLVLSISILVG